MWRPAHGATSRPGPSGPASGYGRGLGRPGPETWVDDPAPSETVLDPSAFAAVAGDQLAGEQEAEASAPVTP
jgi:hypothetical protein